MTVTDFTKITVPKTVIQVTVTLIEMTVTDRVVYTNDCDIDCNRNDSWLYVKLITVIDFT